jgi:DNA-3-methyladenine glycosylase
MPVEVSFLARSVDVVARELLGKLVVKHERAGAVLVGRIVETEAYDGATDAASHAYRGRTKRNAVLFLPAGHAYVYQIHGIHSMLSVVTTVPGSAAAVLIRGLEPLCGLAGAPSLAGPARLTRVLGIDRSFDGHDLAMPPLQLVYGPPDGRPRVTTRRVGLSRRLDLQSAYLAWRFYLLGSHGVSRRDRQAEHDRLVAAAKEQDTGRSD